MQEQDSRRNVLFYTCFAHTFLIRIYPITTTFQVCPAQTPAWHFRFCMKIAVNSPEIVFSSFAQASLLTCQLTDQINFFLTVRCQVPIENVMLPDFRHAFKRIFGGIPV